MSFLIVLTSLGLFCVTGGLLQPEFYDTQTRIIGGVDAPEGSVPYQASLRTTDNSHFCGGSIISDKWVLTAAHCTEGRSKDTMVVVVGTNHISQGGDKYSVEKILTHEDYENKHHTNDVSVVEVVGTIKFNDRVQPVHLPDEDTPAGANLVLTGWGQVTHPGGLPKKLQTLNVTALSVQDCQQSYSDLTHKTICTLTKKGEGACFGDSGGPLVERDRVVGIVSMVVPCAEGYPDIFSRVFAYKDWIKEKTNI